MEGVGYTSYHEEHPQKKSDIIQTRGWVLKKFKVIFLGFFDGYSKYCKKLLISVAVIK